MQGLGPSSDPWGENFSFVRSLKGRSTPGSFLPLPLAPRCTRQWLPRLLTSLVPAGSSLPSQVHLGDITIRLQQDSTEPPTPGCKSSGWVTYSSAVGIGPEAAALPHSSPRVLAAHDISEILAHSGTNGSQPFPLTVVRHPSAPPRPIPPSPAPAAVIGVGQPCRSEATRCPQTTRPLSSALTSVCQRMRRLELTLVSAFGHLFDCRMRLPLLKLTVWLQVAWASRCQRVIPQLRHGTALSCFSHLGTAG